MKTFVITGCFNTSAINGYGRDDVKRMIRNAGHNVRSQLSRATNYLVTGTADVPGRGVGPSKLAQAAALGVPTITLNELYAVLDAA